ncbi:3-deoxy-D-arabinoheptulosonate-7-phosphate synthase [Hymenobacter roseosalivarius DSM 11622]|uniref:3-deoxy-D-arabinoheptulosonate-7-phosphate synthase n=1 Tax=Hymenobacter roseosalivarius DSM 11622 TaxID=645990 RepID=A0A1W1W4G1_9BACT|nr:bifunctional 3-deoxy-7-phosphoheptulonate synthase/chorismate mutase [Hymenobacter roseosalivarius]SMC00505.1 3-deoxy-D-arabinoheptulosonate-7-phosphate synthase [Hymenobacter roseosalivarius DSM 11622]
MIIQLEKNITATAQAGIEASIKTLKYKITEVKTQRAHYLVAIGKAEVDLRAIGQQPGIRDIHQVSDDYQLVSRKWRVKPTVLDLGDGVYIGEGSLSLVAGPCSIESEAQMEKIMQHLLDNNVRLMRGGVFKPRSSPYSFRGLGMDGLKQFHQMARARGIKVVTEVMQVSQVEEMHDYVDVFQVGARNTQNFNLLDALGGVDKPVLIKRGISGTIEELLSSAEYVFSGGNEKLILCERGIRTFETASRNTLDLNAVPILKEKTHLPVVVDPSHGIGIRDYVAPMALAAVMAGADGILYETHEKPEEAASDGQQTLNFDESARLIKNLRRVYELRKDLV